MANGRTFRPGPRAEYKQRPLRSDPSLLNQVVGTVTVTQADDTAAITGTFTDPEYLGDGGLRARQGSSVYRRLASRVPFLRRNLPAPVETYTGTITVTQADDTAAIVGDFVDPAYGDGGTRARQQSSVYRRLASRTPHVRRVVEAPADTTVSGTIAVTQADDTAAITGTFEDPVSGDGGIRARAQSSVYRRLASRTPFTRHLISVPVETYTATIAVTQADDTAAIVGQADDIYTGDSPARARAQSTVYRRLASRTPFTRHIVALPFDTTITGTVGVTQDDDTTAIVGDFVDPAYGDGGTRARQQSSVYRRLASRVPFLRRQLPTPAIPDITGTVGVTQDDDTTAIVGQADPPYIGDGGIRNRHRLAQGHRPRALYCQRRYTLDIGEPPTPAPAGTPIRGRQPGTITGTQPATLTGHNPADINGTQPATIRGRQPATTAGGH